MEDRSSDGNGSSTSSVYPFNSRAGILDYCEDFTIPTGNLVFFRVKIDDERICKVV